MDKQWTMNCVLLGAEVRRLLNEGKEDEAERKLRELTSDFEPSDVNYLIKRIKEGENDE